MMSKTSTYGTHTSLSINSLTSPVILRAAVSGNVMKTDWLPGDSVRATDVRQENNVRICDFISVAAL